MKRYDFELVHGDAATTVERDVAVADTHSLWLRIVEIARRQNTGGIIRVTDEMGDIVVLVGVATATYLCATGLADYISSLS